MRELRLRIVEGGLDDPIVVGLLELHIASAAAETEPGSAHALDVNGLRQGDVSFYSAWMGAELSGVGAFKTLAPDHGEVKSMHVAERFRGRGVASAMLDHIMDAARARGLRRLSLETGSWPYFAPARALYARHGFRECDPFGAYVIDRNSIYMTREL